MNLGNVSPRSPTDLIPKGNLINQDMSKFRPQQDDNIPLKEMDTQLKEMDKDYEVMLMERIESKKQLEAKFQDIQRKIQANRDFSAAEIKRVHDTLKAFRSRFEINLKTLKDEFELKVKLMREYNRQEFKNADSRLDRLENSIHQEVSDRITESDAIVDETQDRLTKLQNAFDMECETRIEREKDIMQEVDDAKYALLKKIDAERTDKSLSLGKFKDDTLQTLNKQHKYIEEFQRKAFREFMRLREQLENEMVTRFENQDETIDNLSQSIKIFQDTMKIVGETLDELEESELLQNQKIKEIPFSDIELVDYPTDQVNLPKKDFKNNKAGQDLQNLTGITDDMQFKQSVNEQNIEDLSTSQPNELMKRVVVLTQQIKQVLTNQQAQHDRFELFEKIVFDQQSALKDQITKTSIEQFTFNETIKQEVLKLEQRSLDSTKFLNNRTDFIDTKLGNLTVQLQESVNGTQEMNDHIKILIKKAKTVEDTIVHLNELTELKFRSDSIISGLTKHISNHVEVTLLQQFKAFEPRIDSLEKNRNKLEVMLQTEEVQIQGALREVKQLDERFQSELKNYLLLIDYETDLQKFALKQEHTLSVYTKNEQFAMLQMQCQQYAYQDATDLLQKQLYQLDKMAKEKLATKEELVQQDKKVRDWCQNSFLTFQVAEKKFQDQVDFITNMHQTVSYIQKQIVQQATGLEQFKKNMDQEAQQNQDKLQILIKEVQQTLTRCALYDDYKDLYNKVLPPLKLLQDQFKEVTDSHEQNKVIIRNFDQQLGNFALKHEILQYQTQLRQFCKQQDFQTFKDDIVKQLKYQNEFSQNHYKAFQEKEEKSTEDMKALVRQSMFAYQSKLSKEKGFTLDKTTTEQLKYIAENIGQLLQNKANAADLIELQKQKTNKIDTEHCLRCIDVMFKQLENVCILVSEVFRQGVNSKKESQVYQAKQQEFLHEQTQILFDWIKKFDPTKIDQQMTENRANLMSLHTFSDKMFGEQAPDPLNMTKTDKFFSQKEIQNDRLSNKIMWASQLKSKNLPTLSNFESLQTSNDLAKHFPQCQSDLVTPRQNQTQQKFNLKTARIMSNSVNSGEIQTNQARGSSMQIFKKLQQESSVTLDQSIQTQTLKQTPIKLEMMITNQRRAMNAPLSPKTKMSLSNVQKLQGQILMSRKITSNKKESLDDDVTVITLDNSQHHLSQ